jgi:hypothetical protein
VGWLERADRWNQRWLEEAEEAGRRPPPAPTAFDRVFDAWVSVRLAMLTAALFAGLVALVVLGVVWVVRQL